MLSVSNILLGHTAGNEKLRYGHTRKKAEADDPFGGAPRPVVAWAVTRACNLRCVHCYASADASPDPDELTIGESLALLDDFKAFGVPAVLFSGGEPLVRPEIFQLLEYAQEIGMPSTLSTNGVLIDDEKAARIAAAGVRYVGVSIDGTRENHDKLRGMQGAFDATLAAIERLKKREVRVGLRFTVHALNFEQLDAIFDLAIERGIGRLCVYHLAYAGRGSGMQKVDLTTEQTRTAVDRIFERTRQAHRDGLDLEVLTVSNHVDAAYSLVSLEKSDPARAEEVRPLILGTGGNRSGCNIASVDARGGVHYDQFSWHYTCGNVRDRPFSEIWTNPDDERLKILRDRQSHLPERCRGCRFLSACNGNLRTRAEAATGNWLGFDPACYLTDEEIATR